MGRVYNFPPKKRNNFLKTAFIVALVVLVVVSSAIYIVFSINAEAEQKIIDDIVAQFQSIDDVSNYFGQEMEIVGNPYFQDGYSSVAIRFNVCVITVLSDGEPLDLYCTLDEQNSIFRIEATINGESKIIYNEA